MASSEEDDLDDLVDEIPEMKRADRRTSYAPEMEGKKDGEGKRLAGVRKFLIF